MTSGGPPAPYGQGHGGPPPPNESVGGTALPPGGWSGRYGPPPGPQRRTGKLVGVGVALAVVLSAAALVVAVVHQPDAPVLLTPPPAQVASPGDASAADKATCEKVGPLLREMVDDGHRFVALGDPGTPARDAGIPAYRATVGDWFRRIQPILDASTDPPRYLIRTLQTMVDFKRLYADNIRPGPELAADVQAWRGGAIAYGGPWEICHGLGVTW